MSFGVMPKRVQGRQNRGAIWYGMLVSRIRRGRLDVVIPRQPRFTAATSPRLAFGAYSENDMRQATARRRAMCSAWADAFGIWATAIEPYSFPDDLPERESQ